MITRPTQRVLLVESDTGLASTIREIFNDQGLYAFVLSHVRTMEDAERHLASHAVDIVLLDFALADAVGQEAVTRTHAAAPEVPIILLCDESEENTARVALL